MNKSEFRISLGKVTFERGGGRRHSKPYYLINKLTFLVFLLNIPPRIQTIYNNIAFADSRKIRQVDHRHPSTIQNRQTSCSSQLMGEGDDALEVSVSNLATQNRNFEGH